VASALVYANHNDLSQQIYVETRGGKLSVRFQKNGDQFLNVTLIGPAVKVFEGEYYL
jgi:diaminopimelate epimerase